MKIYETLFIVDPTLDEEVRNKLADRVKNQIEEKMGGKIRKIDRWGVKQLAFRIKKFNEGDYTVIVFDSDPSRIKLLEEMYSVVPEIFRHLTLRREDLEKHPVAEKQEEEKSEVTSEILQDEPHKEPQDEVEVKAETPPIQEEKEVENP